MPGSRLNVHLSRDSFNTPWGFRLQGGKDLNQPLVVQRVFSNSPAEGELQRGDVIISINNRDASQLTHKQAQDLIKHGGGQVQFVINRPPPGSYSGPLSPQIITQTPRAPTFQGSYQQEPAARQLKIQVVDSPATTSYNGYSVPSQSHAYPSYERQRSSYSQPPSTPTPTTPVPPWAAQQFTAKKISKLSKLGGGGFDFGTNYATLPRSHSSAANYDRGAHYSVQSNTDATAEEVQKDRLATGPIPKVCSLRRLGGGGLDFGSNFGSATLPTRGSRRRLSQPVGTSSSYGHGYQPSKGPTQHRYGGGGQELGSDFGQKGYGPASPQRLQTTLDNLTSPRSPEVQANSPFYQPYVGPSYQPGPQQVYTPTGLLLEQQRLQQQQHQQQQEEQGEAIVPVWQRRKQFQVQAPRPAPVKPKPRAPVSKPQFGNFGIDYGHPKHPQSGWRPTPQYRPGPPSTAPKLSPSAPSHGPAQASPPAWQRRDAEDNQPPAWRNTLKATGVKPWEQEVDYSIEHQPVRSVPYHPAPPSHTGPVSSGPFSPQGSANTGGPDNGPKVVHLQYNSPLHLYSNQNVAETLKGQTQALAGQNKPPPPAITESGERDWSQSAVLKFISQEDTKKSKLTPPAVAPKPQFSPVQSPLSPPHHDIGASDF